MSGGRRRRGRRRATVWPRASWTRRPNRKLLVRKTGRRLTLHHAGQVASGSQLVRAWSLPAPRAALCAVRCACVRVRVRVLVIIPGPADRPGMSHTARAPHAGRSVCLLLDLRRLPNKSQGGKDTRWWCPPPTRDRHKPDRSVATIVCGLRLPLRAASIFRLVATSCSFRHRRRRRLPATYAGPARLGSVNPDGQGLLGSLFVSPC